jgi:hypothetical protein
MTAKLEEAIPPTATARVERPLENLDLLAADERDDGLN